MTTTKWTYLHSAARIACGDALEAESPNVLEDAVRTAWETMQSDGIDDDDVSERAYDYAADSAPTSTHDVYVAFGNGSALRCLLDEAFECGAVVSSALQLETLMRSVFEQATARALRAMPDAVAESLAKGFPA